MNSEGFKRKLTTIFSADVVGYCRLMGDNEEETVKTLEDYRDLMFRLIQRHRGRVVDSPGDNVLAEFPSVVDATKCAVTIQNELVSRNSELPENRRMRFRIGINLGDVIEEGERIYGDGVNIAARLEALADPDGICISKTVFDHIETKLSLEYEYVGEPTVRNIIKPVGVYRVVMEPRIKPIEEEKEKPVSFFQVSFFQRRSVIVGGAIALILGIALLILAHYIPVPSMEPASLERMAFPLPEKPSIAVLPFTNMSGDPNQDYIGDGISENIISSLSKVSRMFVIARNSTFTYKGKPVKVQQVAEELGVRYVLEGSVQKSEDRLRITAQLIDALSGNHLWSEKYDRYLGELFDLQDEITKNIIVALQVELTDGEQAVIMARSTDNLEVWSYMVRGYNLMTTLNRENIAKARELFEVAIKLDAGCVSAWDGLAFTHNVDILLGWSQSPVYSMTRFYEATQRALALDDKDAHAHGNMGNIYLFQRQHEKAISEGQKAISLDPNSYVGYGILAVIMHYSGRFEEAIDLMQTAMRLSPYYPAWFLQYLGLSYAGAERYDESIETFTRLGERCKKGEGSSWWAPFALARIYVMLGKEKEASAYMSEALKDNSQLSSEFIKRMPFKDPAHLQRVLEDFKKAGLPDKPLY